MALASQNAWSSKLTILVSSCWEKNYTSKNAQFFFVLFLRFLEDYLIVCHAFFLGHPVYSYVSRLNPEQIQVDFNKQGVKYKQNGETLMKIGPRIWKLWKFEVLQIFTKHICKTRNEYAN